MDHFTLTRYFCVCNWMCIKTGAAVNSGAGKFLIIRYRQLFRSALSAGSQYPDPDSLK